MGKTNLMQAHHQWATRPADQRFWTLAELTSALGKVRDESHETTCSLKNLRLGAYTAAGADSPDLYLINNSIKEPIAFSHWSFGQLCGASDTPADYMRRLPPTLVSECMSYGLANRLSANGDKNFQLLVRESNGREPELRSLTTKLTRLWNVDCASALTTLLDSGWMVPPARPSRDDSRARRATKDDIIPNQGDFGLSVKVGDMIAPAGLYASDKDMFCFMIHPSRMVDSGPTGLMRGFFLSNSEVGGGVISLTTFLLENVCSNHIVWGANDVVTVKRKHVGTAFIDECNDAFEALSAYADQGTKEDLRMIKAARTKVLGTNQAEVVDAILFSADGRALKHGLTKSDIEAGYQSGIKWEDTAGCDPTTVWGMVHGLTRYSQLKDNADERSKLDAGAGRLLQLVK